MIFECLNCRQSLEVEDENAGEKIHCPTCGQALTIPNPGETAAPVSESTQAMAAQPPMYVPLQPRGPGASQPLVKRRRGGGCGGLLALLLLVGAGGFLYLMYRYQESPQQSWNRVSDFVQQLIKRDSESQLSPAAEETPAASNSQDPILWLIDHREYWPKEVVLRETFEFPAVSQSEVVGAVRVPARASVEVVNIGRDEIEASYLGGRRRIPIAGTDLVVRAEAALAKAESNAGRQQPVVPGARAVKPEPIREATTEEIRTGLGALYTRQATTFRFFGPNNKSAAVAIYPAATHDDGRKLFPLKRQSNNLWETRISGDLAGKFYTFVLDNAEPKNAREVLDPYATNAVANSTRGRITPLTAPVGRGPVLESATDAIIFEMHVRDFTIAPNSGVKNPGLYLGWTEAGTRLPHDDNIRTGLDHLTELGVTHVELLPVQDFENDESARAYNWGYITSCFFSPEGMYASDPEDNSRIRELKALISALHSRGIGVIMDVVYNHTSGSSSLLAIAQDYYFRHQPNGSLANGSGCGNEFNSESPMARRLILDSLNYWTTEFGVDGFRFDLMALIDHETLRQAERELHKVNPNIVLFGEPWTGGSSPLREKSDKTAIHNLPVGAFNDDFRNALKGSPDHEDAGWIQNGSNRPRLKAAMLVNDWCASPAQSINYMTCHDNLVLWDKLVHSMPNASNNLKIATMKLGYLAVLTSQGVPFIHGGEEFARTKGGNNNSFEAPDSVNQVDWQLKREHLDLFKFVRDVIGLRKAHPLFRLRTRADVRSRVQVVEPPSPTTLMVTINGDGVPGETWRRGCVVMNSSDTTQADIYLPSGEWSVELDQDGAAASPHVVSGKIKVAPKTGLILSQH